MALAVLGEQWDSVIWEGFFPREGLCSQRCGASGGGPGPGPSRSCAGRGGPLPGAAAHCTRPAASRLLFRGIDSQSVCLGLMSSFQLKKHSIIFYPQCIQAHAVCIYLHTLLVKPVPWNTLIPCFPHFLAPKWVEKPQTDRKRH